MTTDIVLFALQEYGTKEIPGKGSNPLIMQMAEDCGFTDYTDDDTAWCSLFMNWVALKTGYERTNSLAARSWLEVGEEVEDPELGDVVVYWRDSPDGTQGHVGLFISEENGVIYTLGGNQSNMVSIAGYDPAKLLGYRALSKANTL